MINTDKTIDGKTISYEIFDDGYDIYLDGSLWIAQHEPYGHPMDATKSYEENCLLQIEELTAPVEPSESPEWQNGYDQAVLDLIEQGVL